MTDEAIKFRIKPNVFLYALEASRFPLVVIFGIALAMIPVGYLRTGFPIGWLMVRIVFSIYGIMSIILLGFAALFALCAEFIVTNKRAIVRLTLGGVYDNVSIPLESIRTIELRPYSEHYGSVYFNCDGLSLERLESDEGSRLQITDELAVGSSRHVANLIVRPGRSSAWLSMPSTSPALSGFYGFRQFSTFANLILELQATA